MRVRVVHNTYESTNKSQNLVPLPRRHATTDKRHKKGVFELTDNETAGETRTHPRPRDPAMRSRRAGGYVKNKAYMAGQTAPGGDFPASWPNFGAEALAVAGSRHLAQRRFF